jgi:hypothetical protein
MSLLYVALKQWNTYINKRLELFPIGKNASLFKTKTKVRIDISTFVVLSVILTHSRIFYGYPVETPEPYYRDYMRANILF